MSVVLEELTICVGDGCANRFPDEAGWEGRCPECMALWTTTPLANMIRLWMDACSAAERVFSGTVLAPAQPTADHRMSHPAGQTERILDQPAAPLESFRYL